MRKLRNHGIRKIYVTDARRSQLTADSLRIRLNIDTVHYTANNYDKLLQSIQTHHDANRNILIIAHSNTIPKIILKLGVLDYPQNDIDEWQFDNLFLVTFNGGIAKVKKAKYGVKSIKPATP